jgi:hypothetical protein
MLSAVEIGGLLELIWVAPLAAVGVTATFSACVLGATRSSDARRAGASGISAAWMALAIVAGLAVLAGTVFGIGIIVAG